MKNPFKNQGAKPPAEAQPAVVALTSEDRCLVHQAALNSQAANRYASWSFYSLGIVALLLLLVVWKR